MVVYVLRLVVLIFVYLLQEYVKCVYVDGFVILLFDYFGCYVDGCFYQGVIGKIFGFVEIQVSQFSFVVFVQLRR